MRFITERPHHDLTYSDVFLVPARSEVGSRLGVDLTVDDPSGMRVPLVAANMTSVTGARLAAAMARRGGLGVLPQDLPLQDLDTAIRAVKSADAVLDPLVRVGSGTTVAEALRLAPDTPGALLTLVDGAGEPVRCIPVAALRHVLPDAELGDVVAEAVPAVDDEDVTEPRQAFDLIEAAGVEAVAVMHHGRIIGSLSARSAVRATLYEPARDAHGRLRVAAAVGVNGDPAARAAALVEAGVDVLVLDTAHGHQQQMIEAVRAVAARSLGVPIVAGNIVTAQAARDLAEAGADILKVGVGPGAMCTTRMMTAVGRPQFSAVLETAEAAREHGARVWADGGVRYPRDVALALAAGSSAVMIGSWFAGTLEAPGEILVDEDGRWYKESWGMASTKAVEQRFRRLDPFERARKTLFAEGISSSRILLDPQRPSLDDLLDMITSGLRSSMTYAGAATLPQFAERAVVGVQSAAGYEEGKALPVSW
ncbi:GuaB1 family IMP dehydrogenase-related protein [Microcella daejeonensis]|uniref:GMP reductase n=1 Tax=Microcella daejeonensis TaxID=2994971 RepID=UPI00226ED138|nr:GuaB1 family IMP dehydrogenase-related protein [Microcella daejeonensis]WAB83023.1 GuaB1 family IMP dehydrogenase-related protein [Microcella daejeonensis]